MTKSLLPLQSFLRDLLMSNKMSMANMQGLDAAAMEAKMQLAQTLKYSVIIVSTVPVLCIYPFIQKHFVKGVMIGSVKGLNQRDGVFVFFTVPFGFFILSHQCSILSHFPRPLWLFLFRSGEQGLSFFPGPGLPGGSCRISRRFGRFLS